MFEPLPAPMAFAVYFTIWWITLFAVLPFGVRSQDETGDVTKGTEAGAPVATGMWWKAGVTTVLSAVLFAGLLWYLRATA